MRRLRSYSVWWCRVARYWSELEATSLHTLSGQSLLRVTEELECSKDLLFTPVGHPYWCRCSWKYEAVATSPLMPYINSRSLENRCLFSSTDARWSLNLKKLPEASGEILLKPAWKSWCLTCYQLQKKTWDRHPHWCRPGSMFQMTECTLGYLLTLVSGFLRFPTGSRSPWSPCWL